MGGGVERRADDHRLRFGGRGRGIVPPGARGIVEERDEGLPAVRAAHVVSGDGEAEPRIEQPAQGVVLERHVRRAPDAVHVALPVPRPDPGEQRPSVVGRGHDVAQPVDDERCPADERVHLDRAHRVAGHAALRRGLLEQRGRSGSPGSPGPTPGR